MTAASTARPTGAARSRACRWPPCGDCDAGSWFDPRFAGERIPTLDEALALAARAAASASISRSRPIAAGPPPPPPRSPTASSVSPRRAPPILVSSFLAEALAEVRALMPEIATRPAVGASSRAAGRPLADRLGCTTIHLDQRRLTARIGSRSCAPPAIRCSPTRSTTRRGRDNCSIGASLPFSPTHPI